MIDGKKIFIAYHYIAHYRIPIFKELLKSKELDITLAAGTVTDTNIKIAKQKELNYSIVKNIWLFNKKILWQRGLWKVMFKKYDHYIFLGNPYFISTWVCLFLGVIFRKKTSIWTHGVTQDLVGIKLYIFKVLCELSDYIFLYGHYARNKMIKYGVPEHKLIVVYNSLDYENQLKYRKNNKQTNIFKSYFNNNYPVIIFTGRLTKVKKLNQLLEAVNLLMVRNVNCNVVFVGDGEEKEYLENLAETFNIKHNCWFFGACYDEELISELFYNSRICVSPGNVGLTAMHSLVYGTPVTTHSNFEDQMPEFEAIIDGETGSFFKHNDIKDLSDKIEFWIKMELSNFEVQRKKCYEIIDKMYNPINQRKIFERYLS